MNKDGYIIDYDRSDYCSIHSATEQLNSDNSGLTITQNDILSCAASNLISIYCLYSANLRLINDREPQNIIGNYFYKGLVEILDYKSGLEGAFNNFDTYRVKPLNSFDIQPDSSFGLSPTVLSEHLNSPYYFSTYWYTTEENSDDGGLRIHEGWFLEVSELILLISELPKIENSLKEIRQEMMGSLSLTPTKRMSIGSQQDRAILNFLTEQGVDPLMLPMPPSGKSGIKSICRDALCGNSKTLFLSKSVFNKAWERLRSNNEILDAQ